VSVNRRDLLLAMLGATAPSDANLLAGLLERERQLEAAYAAALERGAIEPRLGELLLGHEREHVRGLELALRGRAAPQATPEPPSDGRRAFARAALDLERDTVAAYVEALGLLRDDRLLQPLGSIMACGAQHEVALRESLGQDLLVP
jgi:Ferritin-like domain